MPNTTSAIKALRQSERRRITNTKRKQYLRNAVKLFEKAILNKNLNEAKRLYPITQKAIDKSAKNGIIKKNAASRRKARLSRLLKNIT